MPSILIEYFLTQNISFYYSTVLQVLVNLNSDLQQAVPTATKLLKLFTEALLSAARCSFRFNGHWYETSSRHIILREDAMELSDLSDSYFSLANSEINR